SRLVLLMRHISATAPKMPENKILSLASVLNSFQNAESRERNPLARLAGFFYCKGLEVFQVRIVPGSRSPIRMHFVKSPSSVPSSFVVEDLKRRTESPVVRIA